VRCGVYAYLCINGTSRAGNYKAKVKLADGTSFDSAQIVQAFGVMEIRRMMHSNMEESYKFLKHSGYLQKNETTFIAKAASMGIGPDEAFATADWLTDCQYFTPLEKIAHDKSKMRGLDKSRGARNGSTLEELEYNRGTNLLAAGTTDVERTGALF